MLFRILRLSIPFIWFGAVIAISFMEAPLKFYAPNITTELGLGIGRLVFYALNKLEILLAILFLISLIVRPPKNRAMVVMPAILFFILALQTLWLLPALDLRAERLLAGEPLPASNFHIVYIVGEVLKIVLLLAIGVLGLQRLAKHK